MIGLEMIIPRKTLLFLSAVKGHFAQSGEARQRKMMIMPLL